MVGALDRTPQNMNYLLPDGYKIVIKKLPTTIFFIQEFDIPGFSLPPVEQGSPFINLPHTGDHVIFEDLTFTFKVDENLKNYMEIYDWITKSGYTDVYSQYKELADKPRFSNEGLYSEISVLITTNIKNPNIEFTFLEAFPIALSGFKLGTTDKNTTEVSATATFKYQKYNITVLPK